MSTNLLDLGALGVEELDRREAAEVEGGHPAVMVLAVWAARRLAPKVVELVATAAVSAAAGYCANR